MGLNVHSTYIRLLDYLVDLPSTVGQLASEDACEIFNRPALGLSRDELIGTVHELCRMGLTEIVGNASVGCSPGAFAAGEDNSLLTIGLTRMGGKVWEEVVEPEWEKYLSVLAYPDDGDSEILIVESSRLEKLKEVLDSIPGGPVFSHLEVVRPWDALYWKRFELGHRLAVKVPDGVLSDAFHLNLKSQWYKTDPWG